MNKLRCCLLVLCACVLTLMGVVRCSSAAELPLGIVAEKPATGRFVKTDRGYMVPYTAKVPLSDVEIRMVPIPGGKFKLGSPDREQGRSRDEGPQVEIEVQPFWMAACELTLGEFKPFMDLETDLKSINRKRQLPITPENKIDVISAPSSIYDPKINFQFGTEPQRPATTMSQFAAKQYTKWLSCLSGQFYRLPTEAEWEYACRAGTTTAYSFGDDPIQLGEYAWHAGNSDETSHLVGQKKPNAWGLYDMHGNVAEWTLDAYEENAYAELSRQPQTTAEAIRWPTKLYPRVLRGGSWDDDASRLRSAARIPSLDPDWKANDPDFPQSPWWLSSDYFVAVGFRIMRPLHPLPRADREKFWQADFETLIADVNEAIDNNGHGARGVANQELLKLLRKAKP